jgi:hypothetical protein
MVNTTDAVGVTEHGLPHELGNAKDAPTGSPLTLSWTAAVGELVKVTVIVVDPENPGLTVKNPPGFDMLKSKPVTTRPYAPELPW